MLVQMNRRWQLVLVFSVMAASYYQLGPESEADAHLAIWRGGGRWQVRRRPEGCGGCVRRKSKK